MHISKRIVVTTRFAALFLITMFFGVSVVFAQNSNSFKKTSETTPPITQKTLPAGTPAQKSAEGPIKSLAPTKTNTTSADGTDEKTIRNSAEAYVKFYGEHDSKGLAKLFTSTAEMIGVDGTIVKGQDEIEKTFEEMFKNNPLTTMKIEIHSIRVLKSIFAIEEGTAYSQDSPDDPEVSTVYIAIHVKQDGKWQLGFVRDWELPSRELTPHDHLQQDLEWLIGEWIDESHDSVVSSVCSWNDNGNFLIQEFRVNVGGEIAMSGTMRIGWDAVAQQFKSWIFDSHGGHSEGLWSWDGERWIVKMNGSTAKGEVGSSTTYYRLIDENTIAWGSFDRIVNGERLENIGEIIVKRRPPAPANFPVLK